MAKSQKKIRLKQTRSAIGFTRDQRATLRGLGLRRVGATAEIEDSAATRGMVRKVGHLITVEEV